MRPRSAGFCPRRAIRASCSSALNMASRLRGDSMKRFLGRGFAAALILVLASGVAWAQASAQLSGTVRDESGLAVPGVTVTGTQTETGFTRTVVSDETGAYVLANLPLGPYRLE